MCDNKSKNKLVICVIYKAKSIFELMMIKLCTNDLVVILTFSYIAHKIFNEYLSIEEIEMQANVILILLFKNGRSGI